MQGFFVLEGIKRTMFVKMNDEKAYATMDGLITMFSRDTQLKVEFGEDDFPAASTDKVVGEDGYQPAGKAFDWDFDIDHYAEKFVAVVDLSTCAADAEKENVASIGTDINAWFSNVANAGNIHIYYTPATKTLTCWYISSNASYGAWKYSKELTDIYSANGVRQNQLQKGLNIVRQANGKTTKIIIK